MKPIVTKDIAKITETNITTIWLRRIFWILIFIWFTILFSGCSHVHKEATCVTDYTDWEPEKITGYPLQCLPKRVEWVDHLCLL